jgi:hypothetical protein
MIAHYVTLIVFLLLTGTAYAADATWKIFEIKGKASLQTDAGTRPLSNDKNLLETIHKGSRVKVDGVGKVVVVSLKSRQAFEVGSNSEGVVEDEQVRALKGTVSVKKGFSLPKGNDGKMGGIVMRGAGNTRSCLKALSPSNTAIVDLSPELYWENNCDGLKQVTITVLADERIVHTAESSETTYKVPVGVLQPGSRYMWLIDGGANFDMASGVFTILPDTERKEVVERMEAYGKEEGDDISGKIAYIYYIDGKGLNEMTRRESEKIRQRFPGAEGLKDLP